MKTTILFALFLFYIGESYCQEAAFDWAGSIGSIGVEANRGMDIDSDGNIYHTGFYFDEIDFDPGPDVFILPNIGGTDCYVTKLDSEGNFEWAVAIAGTNNEQGFDIVCDESGNIYVTGFFQGTVDFDPSDSIYELTTEGGEDCFTLKLNADGIFLWVSILGDGLDDNGRAITTDSDNNVYVTGFYNGTVDFDPSPSFYDITAIGEEDVFIQKLDMDGNFIWAKSIGGADEERVATIQIDPDGNIYLGGNYESTCDFDPSIVLFSLTSSGLFDHYILKLDNDGDFIWAISFGGTSADIFEDLDIDSEGNIYSVGFFSVNIDIDPGDGVVEFISSGSNDFFIQKLDSSGGLIWAKQIGNAEQERVFSLELDDANNIYTTGYFIGTTDFNPNLGVFNFTSEGSSDGFIQKLDEDGEFIWAKQIGGIGIDQGSNIALHPSGDIYLTGEYDNTVDFNPGAAEFNLTSEGSLDIFVLKLNACSPDAVTDEITACIAYTWTNGVTYFEDNNSATQNLLNIDGCDSVVTLDLTITEVDITTTAVGGVITSNATGASYQWLDCSDGYSEIDGETSASFTPTEDGDYAVKVTIDDCSDTSECILIDGVGIEESPISILSIYPNPSNGFFNIDLGDLQVLSIRIYAVNGDLVYATQSLSIGLNSFEINLDAGVYFLEVLTEADRGQFKLVIE